MRKFRLFLAQCLLWWDNGKHILLCAAHLIWPGFIITQILIHIVNLFGLTNCTLKDKVTLFFFFKNSTRAPCEQQAKTVSRRYSRKRKSSRNRFCLFIWGPGRIFRQKNGTKSPDTVPLSQKPDFVRIRAFFLEPHGNIGTRTHCKNAEITTTAFSGNLGRKVYVQITNFINLLYGVTWHGIILRGWLVTISELWVLLC